MANQTGSYSYALGDAQDSSPYSVVFVANTDYCEISQSINMTYIDHFLADFYWQYIYPSARFKFEALIDGIDQKFYIDGLDPSALHKDTAIDVSTYTGVHTLNFRMTSLWNDTTPTPLSTTFIDNIRTELRPVQTDMDPLKNTFSLQLRNTRLDLMKSRLPNWYDLRVGSNLWSLLASMGKEFTKFGG